MLTLQLGDFVFADFEIPASLPFGGSQRLVQHQLPGGERVVQAMGRDDAPLAWSGLFRGDTAVGRARYLDALRIAGKPLELSWGEFRYLVLVERFEAPFEQVYRIPYSITCVVLEDLTAVVRGFPPASIDQAVADDMAQASVLGDVIGDGALSGLLGTLDAAIKTVSDFARATTATINTVLQPLAAVQRRVQILIASAGNAVQNAVTLGGVIPNTAASQSAARLIGQVAAQAQLPQLQGLSSVLGRMSVNLSGFNKAPTAKQVTVGGGTLFDVAAAQYGDATKWTAIAKANGLTDPNLAGIVTLTIPKNPADEGGVLSA